MPQEGPASLRLKALRHLVEEWEAEHGAITVAELDALEDKVTGGLPPRGGGSSRAGAVVVVPAQVEGSAVCRSQGVASFEARERRPTARKALLRPAGALP